MHYSTTQPTSSHKREDFSSSTQSSTQNSMQTRTQASSQSSAPTPYSSSRPSRKNTINETKIANSTSITLPRTAYPNESTTPPTITPTPDKHKDPPNRKCKCKCTLCCHTREWKTYGYDVALLLKFTTKFLIKTSLPLAIPMIAKAEQKLQSEEASLSLQKLHVFEKIPLRCVADYYTHKREKERMMKVDIYVMQDLQVKNPKLATRVLRLAREEYDELWEERVGLENGGN